MAAPDPVWLMLRGLKTLALRVERAVGERAWTGAPAGRAPGAVRVRYRARRPGRGALRQGVRIAAVVDVADALQAERLKRRLTLIENATSLGGVASTLEARVRWKGHGLPGLLRLSVGLEAVEDLWADLSGALSD